MGFTLTDVLLFGGAKENDADNAAFVIMRRNILRWGAIGGYVNIIVHGVSPLVLPDAIANSLSYVKAFGGTKQNGTPKLDAPVDIISNNGALKFAHNIYNQATMGVNKGASLYIQDSVYLRPDSNSGFIIPIKPNTKYTIDPHNSNVTIFRVATADKEIDDTYGSSNPYPVNNYVNTTSSSPITVTSLATDHYLYIQVNFSLFDQVASTITITEYSIYTDGTVETIEDTIGNTATTEMLLKVGDYQDVQSIIDGVVTRKVGVKVFDGTEVWSATGTLGTASYRFTGGGVASVTSGAAVSLCTHINRIIQSGDTAQSAANRPCIRFSVTGGVPQYYATSVNTTLEEWKQFLADQYAAGTPFILVYPLVTATTESVAGQTLQVQDGDNTLEITQASLTGLELEAQYNAAVSLTIQEVEDANLDNNVTVTIQ